MPDSARADSDQLVLNPSILDAALQATIGFSLDITEPDMDSVNLPFALEKLVYHRMTGDSCWVEVVCHNEESTCASSFYDLMIFDDIGRLCVTIKSLEMRKAPKLFLQSQLGQHAVNDENHHLFVPQWKLFDPVIEDTSDSKLVGTTLVVGANKEQLLQLREVRGHVTEVSLAIGASMEEICLLYTSPSPRDKRQSRMPSSA